MRNNIASFEESSSSYDKICAKSNAKINSAFVIFFSNCNPTTNRFLKRRNIISHLFAS